MSLIICGYLRPHPHPSQRARLTPGNSSGAGGRGSAGRSGVVFPLAISTSICHNSVTICSGLYLFFDMTSILLRWILSHSTGYKNPRLRHIEVAFRAFANRAARVGIPSMWIILVLFSVQLAHIQRRRSFKRAPRRSKLVRAERDHLCRNWTICRLSESRRRPALRCSTSSGRLGDG